jgi:hypothetical protein
MMSLTELDTADLEQVCAWVDGPRTTPLVVDAKTTSFPSWVLAHTFAGEEALRAPERRRP